jgi:hypothetical protein
MGARERQGPHALQKQRDPSTSSGQATGHPGDKVSGLRASLGEAVQRIRELMVDFRGTSRNAGYVVSAQAEAAGGLGMSYEVADVMLADVRARVWTLTKVTFTGAAVLRKSKAAYEETWIELSS